VPHTTALGFSALISPLSLDDFFARYFERSHVHLTGDPQRFAAVLDLSRIEQVLWQQAARLDGFVSVLRDGVRQMAPAKNAFTWVRDQFNRGASLVIDQLDHYDLELAALRQRIAAELDMEVHTNVYLTPASHQTFPVHFDVHDTVIVQLHGTKRWHLHARVAEAPLRHHVRPLDPARLGPPTAEAELAPGHLLYIPRGVPHWGVAAGEPSLHVTFGLYPVRHVDLLQAMVQLAADASPALRAAVSRSELAGGDLEGLAAALREVVARAAEPAFRRAAVDRWREHVVARSPALPDGGLIGAFAGAPALGLDDLVERCTGLATHVSDLADKVRIAYAGYEPFPRSPEAASLQAPGFARPAFETIAGADRPFCARDLPGELTDSAKLLLVSQLVAGGLLRRVVVRAKGSP
jgi:hypothetical protein